MSRAMRVPSTLQDFEQHNCLRVSTVNNWNDWEFLMDGKDVTLTASGNFEANSADAVYYATKAGLGISHLSTYMVANDLRDGTCVATVSGTQWRSFRDFCGLCQQASSCPEGQGLHRLFFAKIWRRGAVRQRVAEGVC